MAIIKPLQSITLKNEDGEDTTYVVASAPAIVETTEPASVASFSDGAEGIPVKSLIADINPVQTGSGDPSPSNVRPITGWTGMNVVRTGKNRFDPRYSVDNVTTIHGVASTGYNLTNGVITCTTNVSVHGRRMFGSVHLDAGTYSVSFNASSDGSTHNIAWSVRNMDTDADATSLAYVAFTNGQRISVSFTVTGTANYAVSIQSKSSADGILSLTDVQLEKSASATAYEPYNGTTYPISWADEAGTVYGGTLDVTNGLLTVDRVSALVSSLVLNYVAPSTGHPYVYATIADKVQTAVNDTAHPLMFSMLPYGGAKYAVNFTDLAVFQSANRNIYIVDDSCANKAAYEAKYNNAQIVYYLATPQTYQLTPQAVMTILGQNNIWADTGDVEVAYCADTKMYIDKVIAAL